MADADPALRRCVPDTHVTLAEVACAVRDEMAQTLSDIVFRRTELGTGGHPGEAALKDVATFMQQLRGWTAKRTDGRTSHGGRAVRALPRRSRAPAPHRLRRKSPTIDFPVTRNVGDRRLLTAVPPSMNERASHASRIFLTGGTGFIGSQLAQIAARNGRQVTVASPVNNDAEKFRCDLLERAGITIVEAGARRHGAPARSALPGHDVVIHLAAAQHEAEAPESHFRKVNVEGTRNLLKLAHEASVRRFVHGSTIGVYGDASHGVLDELSPLAPDNPYGRTKAEAERVVQRVREPPGSIHRAHLRDLRARRTCAC